MSAAGPRRVVYRALMGGYETLREEEAARDSSVPFICFTDARGLTSETWEVVHVEPRLPHDSTRSARALKILGHPLLEGYEETLWLDNTVELTTAPDDLFDLWLADADVAAPLHSYRLSVLAEAEVVIDTGLDEFSRVYEQLTHYLSDGEEWVHENPHWTGMLARRRTSSTDRAMLAWWEDVLRYSRRDQLSFVPALRAHGVGLGSVPLDSLASRWHRWPRADGRDPSRSGSGLREALRPAGRVGELQQRLDDVTHALATTVAQREEVIASLEEALEEVRERAESLRAELDTVRHERNLAHVDVARLTEQVERLQATVQKRTARLRRTRRQLRQAREELARPAWQRAKDRLRGG